MPQLKVIKTMQIIRLVIVINIQENQDFKNLQEQKKKYYLISMMNMKKVNLQRKNIIKINSLKK